MRMKSALECWLALTRIRVYNKPRLLKALAGHGPEALFEDGSGGRDSGLSERQAAAISAFDDWAWVEGEMERAERSGVRILTLGGPGYPRPLREIKDPPFVLYARGRPFEDGSRLLAVEGSRHPGPGGLEAAEEISASLASSGVAVASGMAIGCDTAAHTGALRAGGFTIAVLGTGIDRPYPRRNSRLCEEIAERGLVLTEFPFSTPPEPANFLKRNRITAGVSEGVLVIEAGMRSGSLMTARLAFESGKHVFALSDPSGDGRTGGTRWLIEEKGAVPVTGARQILDVVL